MIITIKKENLISARNRASVIVSRLIKEKLNPETALDYFVILNVLNGLINSGGVAFNDDGLVYIDLGGDENAGGEKPTTTEVPGDIPGVDTEDKGSEDGQEEVAPDSAD